MIRVFFYVYCSFGNTFLLKQPDLLMRALKSPKFLTHYMHAVIAESRISH
jgi:hypothetical protein